MSFWLIVAIVATVYLVIGVGCLCYGMSRQGPVSDTKTLLLILLAWPFYLREL